MREKTQSLLAELFIWLAGKEQKMSRSRNDLCSIRTERGKKFQLQIPHSVLSNFLH